MKKVFISIILILTFSSPIFANDGLSSISANMGLVTSSISLETDINDNTKLSIPVGYAFSDFSFEDIPPIYTGVLVEQALNEYIPGQSGTLQMKVGGGVAGIVILPDLASTLTVLFAPVLSLEVEAHFSPNHSLYVKTNPFLYIFGYADGQFTTLAGIDVFGGVQDYLTMIRFTSLITTVVGYRYTFN